LVEMINSMSRLRILEEGKQVSFCRDLSKVWRDSRVGLQETSLGLVEVVHERESDHQICRGSAVSSQASELGAPTDSQRAIDVRAEPRGDTVSVALEFGEVLQSEDLFSRSDRESEGDEGKDADDDGNCELTLPDDVDSVGVEEFCKRQDAYLISSRFRGKGQEVMSTHDRRRRRLQSSSGRPEYFRESVIRTTRCIEK